MARRRSEIEETAADGPDAVPEWVMRSRRLLQGGGDWWKRWLKPGQQLTSETYFDAKRNQRAAAVAWCEERGHSYARTVLGWRHAAPGEVAKGCTTVPEERRHGA